jgi:hypothetical protein
VAAVILFVYRWQRNSWQFANLMKIREPLARAYCSRRWFVLVKNYKGGHWSHVALHE